MLLIYNNKKRKAILNEYCGVRIINSRFTKEKEETHIVSSFSLVTERGTPLFCNCEKQGAFIRERIFPARFLPRFYYPYLF